MKLVASNDRCWVKFCGMAREEDVDACSGFGPDALGFILRKETSTSNNIDLLTIERAASLVHRVPASIATILLVHSSDSRTIVELATRIRPSGLQLQSDAISLSDCALIKSRMPDLILLKKLAIREDAGADLVLAANNYASSKLFDAIVLDTAATPSGRGGTGKTHNWEISADLVRNMTDQRFVLAGGLRPDNVRQALSKVNPFGIDIMSGISDEPGIKNAGKVKLLMNAISSVSSPTPL